MLKSLQKGNNILIDFFQKTSKILCMYVTFTNLKVIMKISQEWSKTKN